MVIYLEIKKLIKSLKKDIIRQESEVRAKIVYPILDILKYDRKKIASEFPVYSSSGRKNCAKFVDNMTFMSDGANNHKKRTDFSSLLKFKDTVFLLKINYKTIYLFKIV